MIKTIIKSIREYKTTSILSSVTVTIEVFVEILIPFCMANLIDRGIEGSNISYVNKYGLYLVILSLIQITFGIISGRFASKASAGFASNLRDDVFDKIQTFSFLNIDKFSSGSLVSRLTTDISNIQQAFQMTIRMAVRGVIMLIFSIIAAFIVSKEIAIIFFIIAPIIGLAFFILTKIAFPLFEKMFRGYDDLNNILSENLRGIRVVKTFNREKFEEKKFKILSGFIYGVGLKAERLTALWDPIMNIAMYSTSVLILYLGAKEIIASGNLSSLGLTTGSLMSLITYSIQILMSLMMISFVFVMLIIASTSMKRIIEIFDEKPNICNPINPIYEVNDGSITFNNVSFSYNVHANKNVLSNINLHINQGEMIGIMGSTGSSKSSLVNLIPRLYDVIDGEILVGNVDVRKYDIKTLRSQIGMVLQKNILFKGTIKSNLEFGKQNLTENEINEALKIACCESFIKENDNKSEIIVEQSGGNFSGGQKQRLCIARALVKKPKILIFDDSTSAVDTKTDAKIRESIRSFLPETTKIIIAQRISSIKDCDRIIVMEDGRIVNIGTHNELLQTSPIYKETYYLQLESGLTE
ncbi:MAG: ABC transporter ATP-binding protein [Eubacteriales bacterium]|nr:ABC transporter ATP-binding protein [Eubacteriales bacterium]